MAPRPSNSTTTAVKSVTQRQARATLIAEALESSTGAATEAVADIAKATARLATREPEGELRYLGGIVIVTSRKTDSVAAVFGGKPGIVAGRDRPLRH